MSNFFGASAYRALRVGFKQARVSQVLLISPDASWRAEHLWCPLTCPNIGY